MSMGSFCSPALERKKHMPMGKGTYGSKRGRPKKMKKGKSMPKKMVKKKKRKY